MVVPIATAMRLVRLFKDDVGRDEHSSNDGAPRNPVSTDQMRTVSEGGGILGACCQES